MSSNQKDLFTNIPIEIWMKVLVQIPDSEIVSVQAINKTFRSICIDNNFWREKLFYKYGVRSKNTDCKTEYLKIGRLYIYGYYKSFLSRDIRHDRGGWETTHDNKPFPIDLYVKYVFCSYKETIVITTNDEVYLVPDAEEGVFGGCYGVKIDRPSPLFDLNGKPLKAKKIIRGVSFLVWIGLDDNVYGYVNGSEVNSVHLPIQGTPLPPFHKKVKDIYGDFHQFAVIDFDNEISVMGSNVYGELGIGHRDNATTLTQLKYDNETCFKAIGCSYGHYSSLIINEKNQVYLCGGDPFSDVYTERLVPTLLEDIYRTTDAEKLSNTSEQSVLPLVYTEHLKAKYVINKNGVYGCIDTDDYVWVWGYNSENNLGLGGEKVERRGEKYIRTPQRVWDKEKNDYFKAKNIAITHDHTYILDFKGNLFMSGNMICKDVNLPSFTKLDWFDCVLDVVTCYTHSAFIVRE